jgi:hypothetical protein
MTVIAQRLCIDHHRRSARVEPAAEVDAGTVDADHDELFGSVDREHLATALERVAPRHREILDLREQRGLSYARIAEELDVPVTTVEALLHRARKALRREFLAVTGDERGHRFAIGLVAGGALARVKAWFAPAVGTAAAGTIAIGLVAGPLTGGDEPPATAVETSRTAASLVTPTSASTAAPAADAVVVAPADVSEHPPDAAGADPPAPVPAADLAVVDVYTTPEAADWAEEQNDGQPVQVPLGPVADVGVDPVQLINDLLDPGGPP